MVQLTSPDSSVTSVPQQYGAGCSAWDFAEGMQYYDSCTTNTPPDWCKQPWCYIDMCNCDKSDLASSTYFEVTGALKLGFSYETCSSPSGTTSDYLQTFCSGKTTTACAASNVCKTQSSACVAKTTAEIRGDLDCPAGGGATESCIDPNVVSGCSFEAINVFVLMFALLIGRQS
jgi:hypothetical protein